MKHIAEQLHCVRKDLDEPADEKLEGVFQNGYALMDRQFYPIKADHGAVLTTSAQRQAALDLTPLVSDTITSVQGRNDHISCATASGLRCDQR